MEKENLTEARKKQTDYQRIPDGYQQALVKTLNPGEEIFWWEMPAFWDTYGPQRRVPRSFFAALITSSLFVWIGTLYWLYLYFFVDDFQFLKIFEFFFLSFSVCLFFAIIEGIYFIIGYGFGLAEGLGQGLYVITDQRLIRIYQRLFFSKASGYTITSNFYRNIREFTPLRAGGKTSLEASLGQLRLEMYSDDSGICVFDPIFLYPLSSSSLFATRKETQRALDPDNILLELNGFLHISNLREIVDILQHITNGELTSASTSFTAKPPTQRQAGDYEMKDIESGKFKLNHKEDDTEKNEAEIRRIDARRKETVRRVVIGLGVIVGGLLVIGLFGWLMRYLRLVHGEDVAAVGLIPSVFGSWFILLIWFYCLFWYGFGPHVDVLHISLSTLNAVEDGDEWLDS